MAIPSTSIVIELILGLSLLHVSVASRFKDDQMTYAQQRSSGLDWWVILMAVLGSIIGGVIFCCACFFCITHIFINDEATAKKEALKMALERQHIAQLLHQQHGKAADWNMMDSSNIYSEVPQPNGSQDMPNVNKAMPPRYNSQQQLPEYVGGGPSLTKGETSNGRVQRY